MLLLSNQIRKNKFGTNNYFGNLVFFISFVKEIKISSHLYKFSFSVIKYLNSISIDITHYSNNFTLSFDLYTKRVLLMFLLCKFFPFTLPFLSF